MFTAAEVGAGNRQAAGRGAPGRGAAEELQVRSGCRSRGLAEAGGRAANVAALGPACGGGERAYAECKAGATDCRRLSFGLC